MQQLKTWPAAAEEAAHSAADEPSDAEISGTRVSALQRFMLSNIPNGNCLLEDNKSDAVAEDLAAAADAAARTSASSSELQTDALSSDTEQGAEERIGSMSAESSSSSVSPPLELQTSIVSDPVRDPVAEITGVYLAHCFFVHVCLSVWLSVFLSVPLSVPSVYMYVCMSVCPPGTVQLLSHKQFHVRHVICHRMAECVTVMSVNE